VDPEGYVKEGYGNRHFSPWGPCLGTWMGGGGGLFPRACEIQ